MVKIFKRAGILTVVLILFTAVSSFAQCAMCRATLENNFSNGDIGPGANINMGILYLLVFPYILVAVVAYFWYRNSKSSRISKA